MECMLSERCASPEIARRVPDGLTGRWWVAHTRARHEKKLEQALSVLNIFSYLPLCERVSRSRATRRLSRSLVPVFPGYLFFIADEEQRYRALRTQHIAQTIEVVDQQALIEQLRRVAFVLASGEPVARSARLGVGDWVTVIAGPLTGLEGVVAQWKARLRLVINVHILGQSVSVEVDADTVERIEPPARRG